MPAKPVRVKRERQPSGDYHGRQVLGRENRKLLLWKALIKHIAGTTTTGLHTVGMWNELRLPASVAFMRYVSPGQERGGQINIEAHTWL